MRDRAAVGDNYLVICESEQDEAPHLSELADGISSVLSGKRAEFALEYPAEVGTEKWFYARVTQCPPDSTARAVVAHEDISESVRLEREIVGVSAHEQQRFRQELHDGLSQQLTGLKFKASLLELHLQSKNIPEAAEAKAMSELLNQATDEASNLARRMRPVEVEARGLMMAVRELASAAEQKHDITCQVLIRRPVFIHDNNTATSLYRIAAEAVENAVTEGEAKRIQIALTDDGQRVTLSVRDNGGPLASRATSGFRAHMMRYHARMIGGALEWRKESQKGVTLVCCFQKTARRAE
jgi:signal transduction histidine kinase